MYPQNRTEGAVLEPADEEFAVGRVVGICRDEPANVSGPVGNAGKREIQTSRNLAAEAEEGIGAFVEKREPRWPA